MTSQTFHSSLPTQGPFATTIEMRAVIHIETKAETMAKEISVGNDVSYVSVVNDTC